VHARGEDGYLFTNCYKIPASTNDGRGTEIEACAEALLSTNVSIRYTINARCDRLIWRLCATSGERREKL
jgi:hypothetical protein